LLFKHFVTHPKQWARKAKEDTSVPLENKATAHVGTAARFRVLQHRIADQMLLQSAKSIALSAVFNGSRPKAELVPKIHDAPNVPRPTSKQSLQNFRHNVALPTPPKFRINAELQTQYLAKMRSLCPMLHISTVRCPPP